MAEAGSSPGIGDEWNGYVWNGAQWVPRVDGSGRVFDGVRWSGPASAGAVPGGYLSGTPSSMFAHPGYAYGLTRQTSDDLQFIARYFKIIIIVRLILAALMLVALVFSVFALGSFVAMLPR